MSVFPSFRRVLPRIASALPGLAAAVAVLCCGLSLLPARLERVKHQQNIGHADGVAYAWQGRTLARGEGLMVPYVTGFFHAYPREIRRHDDQWPPLFSFVLAPVFAKYGAEARVARSTNLVLATLALPLAVWALVFSVTGRAWMGLLGALPVLRSARIYPDGTELLSDLLLTTVFCLFLASLFRSRKHPAWLLAAGAFYALAWYGKGSQILLGGFLAGGVLLLHGPGALVRRWHLGAWLLALLLMFPRLHYNAKHFGRPLHSTQNYVSSFFGLTEGTWNLWDHGFYSIWWDRDLPGLSNRFDHPALHARSMRRNTEVFLRVLFLGLDAERADWRRLGEVPARWQEDLAGPPPRSRLPVPQTESNFTPPSRWPHPWQSLPHLAGAVWGLLALPLLPLLWWRRHRRGTPLQRTETHVQDAVILLGCVLMQSLFVIVFWHAMERLAYPAWPALAALAWSLASLLWTGTGAGLRRIVRRWENHRALRVVTVLLPILFCFFVARDFVANAGQLHAEQETRFRRPAPTEPAYPVHLRELADAMAAALPPDAILMCRNPWQTLWYAPEGFRAVGLPMALPPELLSVAKYYGVTHLVLDRDRPGLRPFLHAHPAAFRRVIRLPMPVYAIDYDALPPGTLVPPASIRPYWDPRTGLRAEEEALRKARE